MAVQHVYPFGIAVWRHIPDQRIQPVGNGAGLHIPAVRKGEGILHQTVCLAEDLPDLIPAVPTKPVLQGGGIIVLRKADGLLAKSAQLLFRIHKILHSVLLSKKEPLQKAVNPHCPAAAP